MPTLSEYAKLSTDALQKAVFTNIITANELMPFLSFQSMEGNSLKYNRENALPGSVTHAVGDTWADTEATYTQKSASLAIVGVQSPLDRYALETRSDQQSQEAVLFAGMTKSLARKIAGLIITGNPGSTTTEWEGLTSLLISDSRLLMQDDGSTPSTITGSETELTLDRLDAMIDMVEDGPPDFLMSNKTMRRKATALSRATGSGVLMDQVEMFGHQIRRYNGIPWIINDHITNSEQYENSGGWGTSTATTIYALKTGVDKEGYTILHNGEVLNPSIQRLGIKETKNENLYRIVVYIQAVLWSAKMAAGLAGIDSAA